MPTSAENRGPDDIETRRPRSALGYQGIGANLLLTMAAAVVPVVIIGVAAFNTISDVKARGARSARKSLK